MKIQDISTHLGITAAALADLMGVSKQALNNYTSGRKGKASKFTADLCAVADIEREEIFFPPIFDSPAEEPHHRWLSLASEALEEAARAGADRAEVERLKKEVFQFGATTLPDDTEFYPED